MLQFQLHKTERRWYCFACTLWTIPIFIIRSKRLCRSNIKTHYWPKHIGQYGNNVVRHRTKFWCWWCSSCSFTHSLNLNVFMLCICKEHKRKKNDLYDSNERENVVRCNVVTVHIKTDSFPAGVFAIHRIRRNYSFVIFLFLLLSITFVSTYIHDLCTCIWIHAQSISTYSINTTMHTTDTRSWRWNGYAWAYACADASMNERVWPACNRIYPNPHRHTHRHTHHTCHMCERMRYIGNVWTIHAGEWCQKTTAVRVCECVCVHCAYAFLFQHIHLLLHQCSIDGRITSLRGG